MKVRIVADADPKQVGRIVNMPAPAGARMIQTGVAVAVPAEDRSEKVEPKKEKGAG